MSLEAMSQNANQQQAQQQVGMPFMLPIFGNINQMNMPNMMNMGNIMAIFYQFLMLKMMIEMQKMQMEMLKSLFEGLFK